MIHPFTRSGQRMRVIFPSVKSFPGSQGGRRVRTLAHADTLTLSLDYTVSV